MVQIVGATLRDGEKPVTNFVAGRSAGAFAAEFARDGLPGGHVILLGPDNETAAKDALAHFPGGLHVGGGVEASNARGWIDAGASHVIATSFLFEQGRFSRARLDQLCASVGRERLVIDLSCRALDGRYRVMSQRWQTATELEVNEPTLRALAECCAEFLIHAVAVEGLKQGPDPELLRRLGDSVPIPTTYAGGIRSLDDIESVRRLGQGRLDFTVGSALDLFGGTQLRYRDLVALSNAPASGPR